MARDRPFSLSQSATMLEHVSLSRARLIGAPACGAVDATATACGQAPFVMPLRPYTCQWEDPDAVTVSLDASAPAAFAAGLVGVEQFCLRFTGASPVSPAMARHWATTVMYLDRDLLGNEVALAALLLRTQVFRSLATAALQAFLSTFLDWCAAPVPQSPAPAGIRRAIAFLEAHLEADIDLTQIAEAARMSPWGLQAAFRRDKDTTPVGYLRSARSDAARTDLMAADLTTGETVAEIATRWGFGHPGRFAAAYRTCYGQWPSTTLHA